MRQRRGAAGARAAAAAPTNEYRYYHSLHLLIVSYFTRYQCQVVTRKPLMQSLTIDLVRNYVRGVLSTYL